MCLRLKTEGIADDREAVDTAPIPWRPLGQVFVEKGLITEEELEEALAEQQATGKRLGEILVARGLVSGPDLTAALMDQLGVEVQRDQGFGSGLWSEIQRRHARARRLQTAGTASAPPPTEAGDGAPEEGELVDQRPPRAPGERPSLVVLEGMLDELEEPSRGGAQAEAPSGEATPGPDTQAATHLAALEARLAERQAEAATAQAELERLREEAAALAAERAEERSAREAAEEQAKRLAAEAGSRLAELERARAELERRAAELVAARGELERLRAELTAAQAELTSARTDLEHARAEGEQREAAQAEAAAALHSLEREVDAPRGRVAAGEARAVQEAAAHAETLRVLAQALDELAGRLPGVALAAPDPAPAPVLHDGHLLFLPGACKYELVSRDGLPPDVGGEVEIGGQLFAVTKVGRSPIPFDRRPCAYLQARR
jgi:DNA repair exonuclease SbcCD ATPase subunit